MDRAKRTLVAVGSQLASLCSVVVGPCGAAAVRYDESAADVRHAERSAAWRARSAALARLGVRRGEELRAWPAGYVGSASHSGGIAVAVAARSRTFVGLGVDLEFGRLADDAGIRAIVLTPREMRSTPCGSRELTARLTMKEAYFKACARHGATFVPSAIDVEPRGWDPSGHIRLFSVSGGPESPVGTVVTRLGPEFVMSLCYIGLGDTAESADRAI